MFECGAQVNKLTVDFRFDCAWSPGVWAGEAVGGVVDGRGGSADQAVGVGAGLGLAAWRPSGEHDGAFGAVEHDMLDHAVDASLQQR